METAFLIVWTVLIFASIAWYAFLVFYVGVKGGREILKMADDLTRRDREDKSG